MVPLILSALFAQPGAPDAGLGRAPVQVLAVIDAKGNLALTRVRPLNSFGPGVPLPEVALPPGKDKGPVAVPIKVTSLAVITVELPASGVEAQTVAGKAIAADKLAELLAKERPVLIAMDGKKVDAFHLKLYKEDTIILITPPAASRFFSSEVMPDFGAPPPLPAVPIDPMPRKVE